MHLIRFGILLLFLLLHMEASYSQENGTRVNIDSQVNNTHVYSVVDGMKQGQTQRLYVKTNAVGWAMGITNVAAEIDLDRKWTVTLPFYWSSWNYFKTTLKFRTVTLQPEVRYWIMSDDNDGPYVGAHLGLGWYNFALDGNYRIQDHGGHSPSFGGGISGGYRMPVSHDERWKVEFSLGVGVYGAHYDKYRNYRNGLQTETHRRTWFGIDQAAASIVYTFDISKKGGTR